MAKKKRVFNPDYSYVIKGKKNRYHCGVIVGDLDWVIFYPLGERAWVV